MHISALIYTYLYTSELLYWFDYCVEIICEYICLLLVYVYAHSYAYVCVQHTYWMRVHAYMHFNLFYKLLHNNKHCKFTSYCTYLTVPFFKILCYLYRWLRGVIHQADKEGPACGHRWIYFCFYIIIFAYFLFWNAKCNWV